MAVFDLKCPTENCPTSVDDFLGTYEEAMACVCILCSTIEQPVFLIEDWARRRIGGQIGDSKKLPNGDVVSRARLLGAPNTWDKRPTKFAEISNAQLALARARAGRQGATISHTKARRRS